MQAATLVAYATRAGSTAEVAESIAITLREAGIWADPVPVARIDSLQGTTALILGVPLYVGRFPKEFHRFLKRQRPVLEKMRPWCFVLGPTRTEPNDFEVAQAQAARQFGRYPWLHPVEVKIFGGRWNVERLPFPFSLARQIPKNPLSKIPGTDIRDWEAIHSWSLEIARELKPAA